MRTAYRADIDGIRALAVTAVVIFHAWPHRLPGGYVGVDVFFVISGFLLSRVLVEQGPSYRAFLMRRLRRFVPALTGVLVASLAAGWFCLTRSEYLALGKEAVAGSVFLSNVYYWTQTGYFAPAAELKPLLHLWSLGVEMQFCLLFPLLARRTWPALTALSFALTLLLPRDGFAYYWLPARLWEFLAGALIAHANFQARKETAWLGLAAITVALFATEPRAAIPLSVLGTSLLLLGPPNRPLAWRAVATVGKSSYSIYLWHWPLIAFASILAGARPPAFELALALLAALILAASSYRWIESLRDRIAPLSLLAGTAALGLAILGNDGLPNRRSTTGRLRGELDHGWFLQYGETHYPKCEVSALLDGSLRETGLPRCRQSRGGTEYDLLILGDSHAEHLFYGLAEQLATKNVAYATTLDVPSLYNPHFSRLFRYLLSSRAPRKPDILLNAAWAQHGVQENLLPKMITTIVSLQKAGYRVMLADDVPLFGFDARVCKLENHCRDRSPWMDITHAKIRDGMLAVEKATGAHILFTHDAFFEGGAYFMAKDGNVFYRDNHHLNLEGSRFLASELRRTGQLTYFEMKRSWVPTIER